MRIPPRAVTAMSDVSSRTTATGSSGSRVNSAIAPNDPTLQFVSGSAIRLTRKSKIASVIGPVLQLVRKAPTAETAFRLPPPFEAVVHSTSHNVLSLIRGCREHSGRRGGETSVPRHCAAPEIDAEVFTLDGPIAREHPLQAGPRRPADVRPGACGGSARRSRRAGVETQRGFAVGEPGGSIQQHLRLYQQPSPPPNGPKPFAAFGGGRL